MKKIIFVLMFICLGISLFGQESFMDLGIGFQYGFANVREDGVSTREIKEPGILFTLRSRGTGIGLFGRVGLLFPASVTEGGLTLDYSNYNFILFYNIGMGPSYTIPFDSMFSLVLDLGISINDLNYGGSYRDTIDASWQGKFESMGTVHYYWIGHEYKNIKIKERYNDVAIGILGNVGLNMRLTRNISLQLAAAVSYDFFRIRSYRFFADFLSGNFMNDSTWPYWALDDFNHSNLTIQQDEYGRDYATKLDLESNRQFDIFRQFTFLPSISVIFRF